MTDQFKNLKKIEPDPDFLARSKRSILTSPQKPQYLFGAKYAFNHLFKISFALGLMTIMLLAVSGRLSPAPGYFLASINNKQLMREIAKVDFNIQLAEVKYYQEISKQINLALNEIINNGHAGP